MGQVVNESRNARRFRRKNRDNAKKLALHEAYIKAYRKERQRQAAYAMLTFGIVVSAISIGVYGLIMYLVSTI